MFYLDCGQTMKIESFLLAFSGVLRFCVGNVSLSLLSRGGIDDRVSEFSRALRTSQLIILEVFRLPRLEHGVGVVVFRISNSFGVDVLFCGEGDLSSCWWLSLAHDEG